jgi:hypothetical protein
LAPQNRDYSYKIVIFRLSAASARGNAAFFPGKARAGWFIARAVTPFFGTLNKRRAANDKRRFSQAGGGGIFVRTITQTSEAMRDHYLIPQRHPAAGASHRPPLPGLPVTSLVVTGLFIVAAVAFVFNFCEVGEGAFAHAPVKGVELVTATVTGARSPAEGGSSAGGAVYLSPALWVFLAFVAAAAGITALTCDRGKAVLVEILSGVTGIAALTMLQWAVTRQFAAYQTSFLAGYWTAFTAFAAATGISGAALWRRAFGPSAEPQGEPSSTTIHISIISRGEEVPPSD